MTWRFFDRDGDGIKTASEIAYAVRVTSYVLIPWAMIIADIFSDTVFSDVKFIAGLAASFGAATFEIFIKAKYGGKDEADRLHSNSLHSDKE